MRLEVMEHIFTATSLKVFGLPLTAVISAIGIASISILIIFFLIKESIKHFKEDDNNIKKF